MAKGKKEPINITPPTPAQFLVKSERVKVVIMFNVGGDGCVCCENIPSECYLARFKGVLEPVVAGAREIDVAYFGIRGATPLMAPNETVLNGCMPNVI